MRLVADTEEGALDVSCLGTFTMRWLIPRLYRFQEAHPGIEVRLSSSTSDPPVDFGRDGFDVAIRGGTGPWPRDAEVMQLFPEEIGAVLAPQLARAASPDFAGTPVLHTRTRPTAWPDWCARSGVRVAQLTGTEYEHFYFMLEAATASAFWDLARLAETRVVPMIERRHV